MTIVDQVSTPTAPLQLPSTGYSPGFELDGDSAFNEFIAIDAMQW